MLQEPDRIVEHDIATFAAVRPQTVPRRLIEHPEYLSINAAGQMLFLPPRGAQWAAGDLAQSADRAWFWDGHRATEWKLAGPTTSSGRAGDRTVTETAREWLLSSREDSVFWIEYTSEKIVDTSGAEMSVRSRAHVWRTDLAGDNRQDVTTLAPQERCECTTGVCSESCPTWSFWAPNRIVGDFFLATRMTEGQIGSTYHESVLYRRAGSRWVPEKVPQPLEAPLAASRKGETLIAAVLDGGCCGWENEGSDQLLLLKSGKSSVIYDEARRYDNGNYDVSFYVSDAQLSADDTLLAYTLASTARPGSDIRLSDNGKESADELARVRRTIAELPSVEIVRIGTTPRTVATMTHTGLVGWVGARELLVAQNGRLALCDAQGAQCRQTPITARSAADTFLR